MLLNRASVTADGQIHVEGSSAMPEGMNYRVLVGWQEVGVHIAVDKEPEPTFHLRHGALS